MFPYDNKIIFINLCDADMHYDILSLHELRSGLTTAGSIKKNIF